MLKVKIITSEITMECSDEINLMKKDMSTIKHDTPDLIKAVTELIDKCVIATNEIINNKNK